MLFLVSYCMLLYIQDGAVVWFQLLEPQLTYMRILSATPASRWSGKLLLTQMDRSQVTL